MQSRQLRARDYFGVPKNWKPGWILKSLNPGRVPALRHMRAPWSSWGPVHVLDPAGQTLEPEYRHAFSNIPRSFDQAKEDLAAARFLAAYSKGPIFTVKAAKNRARAVQNLAKARERRREAAAALRRERRSERIETMPPSRPTQSATRVTRELHTREPRAPQSRARIPAELPGEIIFDETGSLPMVYPPRTMGVKFPRKFPSRTHFSTRAVAPPPPPLDEPRPGPRRSRRIPPEPRFPPLPPPPPPPPPGLTKSQLQAAITSEAKKLHGIMGIYRNAMPIPQRQTLEDQGEVVIGNLVPLLNQIPGLENITEGDFGAPPNGWRAMGRFLSNKGTQSHQPKSDAPAIWKQHKPIGNIFRAFMK